MPGGKNGHAFCIPSFGTGLAPYLHAPFCFALGPRTSFGGTAEVTKRTPLAGAEYLCQLRARLWPGTTHLESELAGENIHLGKDKFQHLLLKFSHPVSGNLSFSKTLGGQEFLNSLTTMGLHPLGRLAICEAGSESATCVNNKAHKSSLPQTQSRNSTF